jgi:histidinol-phosphate aminotransferase
MLGALAARAAIQDGDYVTKYVTEVLAARELTYVGLEKLNIPYWDSQGNFVLMKLDDRAAEICGKLREAGILLRNRSHEIAGTVRVTVGTRDQMRQFLAEMEKVW